ncbi:MAG TPA: cobalamin biosynthesis protein [Actinobacteria bacterium]|nr:cobalamin biosynthesis protein [Actinomycetes bacterium]HEX21582.1 cobalamin biosynthesis protein [Actinomycetota bacterium]
MKRRKLYLGIIILAILSPLGLLATGSAWGEWTAKQVGKQVGFVPKGMLALESLWYSPLRGYRLPGSGNKLLHVGGYLLSAAIGIGLILIIFKFLAISLPDDQPNEETKNDLKKGAEHK